MKKLILLTCLMLLLAGCNAQPTEIANEPENDVSEAACELECEVTQPSIETLVEDTSPTPEENFPEVSDSNEAESNSVPIVDTSNDTPEEAISEIIDETEEPSVQAVTETEVEEPSSTPPPVVTEPEPTPVQPTELETPNSAYDYSFDIETIRQELLAIGTGMGLSIDNSLTPYNSSWANPVTASASFQGAGLERTLRDYVRSIPDIIVAYSGEPIQYFNIYAESLGGGSYQIYFLY